MTSHFDVDQTQGEGIFAGYSKDRLGVYKAYKRNMINRNK